MGVSAGILFNQAGQGLLLRTRCRPHLLALTSLTPARQENPRGFLLFRASFSLKHPVLVVRPNRRCLQNRAALLPERDLHRALGSGPPPEHGISVERIVAIKHVIW